MASTSKSKTPESVSFREITGLEMVDLYVGPEKAQFRVHKSVLCAKIPYFEKMFQSGGFIEASDNSATFPEDSVQAFDVLIEWVYTGALRPMISDDKKKKKNLLWNPLEFYILLDKMCLAELMDITLDLYREKQRSANLLSSVATVATAYRRLPAGSGFCRFVLQSLLYAMTFKGEAQRNMWSTSVILCTVQANAELCQDLFELMRNHLGIKVADPRVGDNCVYHCHKAGEECPLKEKKGNAKAKV